MAPWGRSAPRGAQVVAPAGAGERLRPVRVGGCTGWCRDVREAAVEREAQRQPGPQPLPGPHPQGGRRQQRSPRRERWGATCRPGPQHTFQVRGRGQRPWGRGHSQVRGVLLADVLLQDAGVYVGGLQGTVDVVACRRGAHVSHPEASGPCPAALPRSGPPEQMPPGLLHVCTSMSPGDVN